MWLTLLVVCPSAPVSRSTWIFVAMIVKMAWLREDASFMLVPATTRLKEGSVVGRRSSVVGWSPRTPTCRCGWLSSRVEEKWVRSCGNGKEAKRDRGRKNGRERAEGGRAGGGRDTRRETDRETDRHT